MFVLHYFNWAGTPEDFKEFARIVKDEFSKAEGVNLIGIFVPTSEWHYVIVWDSKTYEKVLQIYRTYAEKYGRLKIALGKLELLHTLEEIPFL